MAWGMTPISRRASFGSCVTSWPAMRAVPEVIFKAAEGDFATQRDVSRRKRDIKTVALKVRLDNSQRNLVPGMTAEVVVPRAVIEGRAFAPSALGKEASGGAGSLTQPAPAAVAPASGTGAK